METRIKTTFRLSTEATKLLLAKQKELGVKNQNAALESLLLNLSKSDAHPQSDEPPPVDTPPEKKPNLTSEGIEGWLSTLGEAWDGLLTLTEREAHFVNLLKSQTGTQERLLAESQAKLSEVMLTAEKATEDLKSLCESVELAEVQKELREFSRSLEEMKASHTYILSAAVEDIVRQTKDTLLQTSFVIERARAEIDGFESQYSFHQKEIETVVERVKRGLKITPTVALSVVGVSCTLAILVSVHFIPTFEKYQSEKLISETITPVLKSEIQTAFEKMRVENQEVLNSYARSEQQHFEDFSKKYRGRIQGLIDEKIALKKEIERVTRIANENFDTSKYYEKEIQNLKSGKTCGVISGNNSTSRKAYKTGFFLLLSPMFIWIFLYLKRRRTH